MNNALLRELTAQIVTSYVGHQTVSSEEVPKIVLAVSARLATLGDDRHEAPEESWKPSDPRRSLTQKSILCMECGWKGQTLKNHLRARHGTTPEIYRSKWGLPTDYPMIAPEYSLRRAEVMRRWRRGSAPLPQEYECKSENGS